MNSIIGCYLKGYYNFQACYYSYSIDVTLENIFIYYIYSMGKGLSTYSKVIYSLANYQDNNLQAFYVDSRFSLKTYIQNLFDVKVHVGMKNVKNVLVL